MLSFEARSQNCEKRLLALSCLSVIPSVHLYVWNSWVPSGRIFMRFDI
jgi:hypothetical protein